MPLKKPKPVLIVPSKPKLIRLPKARIPRTVRVIRTEREKPYIPDPQEAREREIEALVRSLKSEIASIDDPELHDQWDGAISEVAKDGDMSRMLELARYRRKVVPIDEFLFSNTYMGLRRGDIYPGVLEALHELDTDKYNEAVFKGAIGGGKSTVANLGIPRQLYKLSCMRSPQDTFGVQPYSSLVFTIQSVRLSTAKKAVFGELGKFINNSPFFTEIYPYDKRVQSQMMFRQQNVILLPVSSSDTGAISMNVIGGILDEMNFMQKVLKSKQGSADETGEYDQAKTLYENLSRRRKSRFMHKGNLPGILYLISSSRYPDDFTEVKAAESAMMGGPDEKIYVWSKSLWESKGRDNYSPEEFRVILGDERARARIMAADEPDPPASEEREILRVPEDFRSDFEKNINDAIRDFGGRTTLASRPFITNPERIYDAIHLAEEFGYASVIPDDQVDLSIGEPTILEQRVRSDVQTMRVAHADLAVTRDSAGLAVGHVAGTKTIERKDPETGKIEVEVLPIIAYDLVLRIMPPPNGEIDFSQIRKIIYRLRDEHNLPIKVVTTDGFQSVDFRQILAKKRFATDYVSMDKTVEPYRTLRDALNDGRVFLPGHQHLLKELVELEYVRKNTKEKIDHKPRGSKDVADAVCGVASYLMTRRNTWSTQPKYQARNGMLLHGNRTHIESVRLEELDTETFETLYINGRAVIQHRSNPQRRGIVRRKAA